MLVANRQKRRVNRRRLARIARSVMAAEGCHPRAELSVVIGDDEWLQKLNREYLGKDAPTDVLAFPQGREPNATMQLLGDVAVSGETAARQAEELGHGLEEEVAILLTHGILHLTGWRDDSPARRRRMMRRATELLSRAREQLAR